MIETMVRIMHRRLARQVKRARAKSRHVSVRVRADELARMWPCRRRSLVRLLEKEGFAYLGVTFDGYHAWETAV